MRRSGRHLADEWIIDIPGITSTYADYAKDPCKHEKAVADRATAGAYQYYYPREGTPRPVLAIDRRFARG